MVSEATRESAPTGASPGCRSPAMTANASLADREAASAGMNDHVAKPIDKERLVLCLLGHLGRSGARGAPATAADAGELVEARGDIVGRFRRQPEPIVQVLALNLTCRTSSNASSARAMSVGSAATLHTIKGSAFHRWRQRLAGRASELEQALRRADPRRYGNPRRHPPRRTAHPVRCLPAPPAGDVRRRAGGVGELNPGAVACPAKDSGGPGARLHPLRPVGRITPWALSADTPEARPVLSDILFLSFSASGVAQQVVGVEQGVGDFRALLQAAADGGGNRLAGLAEPWLLLEAHADAAHAAHSPKAGAIRAGGCPVVPPCAAAGVPVFRAAQGFQRAAALLFLAGQEEDATVRAGASRRSRSQTQAPGGQGWRRGGEALMATSWPTGVPRRYAPSPSRARFSASAAPCPAAPGPLRMAVGDLHPLGIGIVAVARITSPRSRLRDERHVGAEAVGGTGLVQQALALQRLWRGQPGDPVVAAIGVELPACRRFREIGQS